MDSCSSSAISLILSGADLALNNQSLSNRTCASCRFRETCNKTVFQSKGVDHATSRHSLQILPMRRGFTVCLWPLSTGRQATWKISVRISGGILAVGDSPLILLFKKARLCANCAIIVSIDSISASKLTTFLRKDIRFVNIAVIGYSPILRYQCQVYWTPIDSNQLAKGIYRIASLRASTTRLADRLERTRYMRVGLMTGEKQYLPQPIAFI